MSVDPSSFANIHEIRTQFIEFDVTVDFQKSELAGTVVLSFEVLQQTKLCVLDSSGVTINSITFVQNQDQHACTWTVGKDSELGSPVNIELGQEVNNGEKFQLKISFATSPNASGIQWLPPSQTDGKQHPYMFTQFQATHCRSFIPCQDSPAVKIPYKAQVRVDKPLVALMSALSEGQTHHETYSVYNFHQPVPIPTYLIALVVGQLESRELGPRTRIWSEPAKIEAGSFEFTETESFLKTAEDLLTPYEWGRYDLLLLPGSFPYGGMENPCLTFITPTLLAGDRSLTGVVAHEIAHSWMGNLVTSKTWEHFWLNEGFTVFVERKIKGRLHGENYRHFEALLGAEALRDSIAHFGPTHSFTQLVPELKDANPDDAFSSVPYEKGFQFLWYLETLVGIDNFEQFLKNYVNQFKFRSIESNEFKAFFIQNFENTHPEQLKKIDWQAWFYQPGPPIVDVPATFDTTLANASIALADKWAKGEVEDAKASDIGSWTSPQIVMFLTTLVEKLGSSVNLEKVKKLEEVYRFSSVKNSEIRFRWYTLVIRGSFKEQFNHVVDFLKEQGRMKFVRPLYRELYAAGEESRQVALETFGQHGENYHNIARKMISADLKLTSV